LAHSHTRTRQHVSYVLATLVATSLLGCGSLAPGVTTPPSKPAALQVNHQSVALEITAPASVVATGAIALNFNFPSHKAYALTATPDDIAKITVALKTRSFLLLKTLATAEVTRASIVSNRAAVQFTGLKATSYTLAITAFDASGTTLGSTTATADVSDGQTATVNAKLQVSPLTPSTTAATGGSGLGVNLSITNGRT
jgi:hypothetical protein